MAEVAIIGAGPAGLTAAHELARLGLRAILLETGGQVGGLSRTVNYKGYRFDIGGHRFFSKIPLINALWQDMLGEDFLLRPRLSRIHYRGHFFDYPLKPFNTLAGLGSAEALRIGLSYVRAKANPQTPEVNFEQWVSNRFGSRLYEIFFKTYTEKVWGIPCREISADWAAQRIKNLSLGEAVRHALFSKGADKNGELMTTLIDHFHYPRLGPGMMWERCQARLAMQGSETLHGIRVNRIRHRRRRVECLSGTSATGEIQEFTGDHFISTMPLGDLIHALNPAPPEAVLQAANALRYRDYLTVVLIAKRAAVFPDNWLYVHSPEIRAGRIQNYKNWSPEMVPDPSRTSLGLEYFLDRQDATWSWPRERLIELAIQECKRIGLVEPDEIMDGTVVRALKAYPIYDQRYLESVAAIRHYLKRFENLQTIGRNGLHRYNNQDHSMLTGIYAARNVIGETHDVWSVNTELDYLEGPGLKTGSGGGRMAPEFAKQDRERQSATSKALQDLA